MFRSVLIANRGEIAVRITQTLQEMGIKVVAVYSDPDRTAKHVEMADYALPLGGQTPAESYLNMDRIIEIARITGVDAIHPGFGFLSENAQFAQAVIDAGMTFIGPSPHAIKAMGDKIDSKILMEQAGVPVVPGWTGNTADMDQVRAAAEEIGYPILVKAAAGGGGKGMRIVHEPAELEAAVEGASREARKAFGDDRVFIEKYVSKPRHVEFQIFGDHHGNVVHLFERECSIQRRHQKIVEETPSPALTPELREKMGQAAIQAAKAIHYTNAGTVEFILDASGTFYFLEMNTRLQVEHPITEMVTGQNLVRTQILVACGEPLPFTQADLKQTGHAIECRVYAEDPENGFLPSTGKLYVYREPAGPGIRVDSGVKEGDEVTIHYDPMLAKVIVWDKTRDGARQKMQWALEHFIVLGVTTNIGFLHEVMGHPAFASGDIDTHFLEHHLVTERDAKAELFPLAMAVGALALQTRPVVNGTNGSTGATVSTQPNPWTMAGRWRNT